MTIQTNRATSELSTDIPPAVDAVDSAVAFVGVTEVEERGISLFIVTTEVLFSLRASSDF